jgi:hypothetical protein
MKKCIKITYKGVGLAARKKVSKKMKGKENMKVGEHLVMIHREGDDYFS